MSGRHLVLVGLPGSGKSTVGESCATRLDRPLVDTDEVLQAAAGMRTTEIFAVEGEEGFRAREQIAVADAVASPVPAVIACGGGAVLRADNRTALRQKGFVVWLRASPDELARRVGNGKQRESRPLLAGPAPAVTTLSRLARLREDAYVAAAHAVVDTDGRSIDDVTGEVVQVFEDAS